MFEDFEFEPVTVGLTLVFYVIVLFGVWRGLEGWRLTDQILISVLAPFIFYFVINWQINK